MKFILVFTICAQMYQHCLPPTSHKEVYTTHYEKASLRAWNNTVLEVKKDQQYSSATPQDGNIDLYTKSYEEIKDSLLELESLGIKC